jgi:hypothetical protein
LRHTWIARPVAGSGRYTLAGPGTGLKHLIERFLHQRFEQVAILCNERF